jgi:O-antigen biosynthesis protein
LSNHGIDYKIAPQESISIIGSNSISALGELYTPDFRAINAPMSRRNKRLFDIGISFIVLISFPIWFFVYKRTFRLLFNALLVLFGQKTWVGYIQVDDDLVSLPKIKKGVFTLSPQGRVSADQLSNINLIYAKNYKVKNDFLFFWHSLTSNSQIQ